MTDYVDKADRVMKKLCDEKRMPTTTKIRKFLTAVNTISGKVNRLRDEQAGVLEKLPADIAAEVKFLKVKLAYQVGRAKPKKNGKGGDVTVESFEKEAQLMAAIDAIGDDVKKYEDFAKYVEALIAYHKFYGGED